MGDHFVVFHIGQSTVCLLFHIYKVEELVGLNFVYYLPSFAIYVIGKCFLQYFGTPKA